jgi:hypothetical protein
VWTAKGQRIREIYATVPAESPSLGLALQWSPLAISDDVWHVLQVAPNSPADLAGLLPYGDYIIGSPEGLVRGESGLPELVDDFLHRPLRLFVYNHEYNVTRPVTITPSPSWGGPGALGCTLGFGALHRIPAPLEEPPHAPGETMFETVGAFDEKAALVASDAAAASAVPAASFAAADFLVPADLPVTSPPPATNTNTSTGTGTGTNTNTTSAHGQRKKPRHLVHAAPPADIDDYFKESEQKSREVDHAPSPKAGSGVPPPPKASGPPKVSPGAG